MRKLIMLCLAIFLLLHVCAQTFYQEKFDGVTAPALPAGWVATGTTSWVTSTASASTPVIPYSGSNNLIVQDCTPAADVRTLTTPAISTIGRTNIVLSYGIRRTASFPANSVNTSFSIDGGLSWTPVTIGSNGSTTWSTEFATLPVAAEGQADVRIRWSFTTTTGASCASSGNFRIDAVTLAQGSVLPLVLKSFSGTHSGTGFVFLTWETESEENGLSFAVEKSANSNQFTSIAVIPAAGTSSASHTYTFNDVVSTQGSSFYRLKLINQDGSYSYSKILKMMKHGSGIGINAVYPLPVSNELSVSWNSNASSKTQLVISDLSGRTLVVQYLFPVVGYNQTKVNTSQLKPGTYFLSIKTETGNFSDKFIKQ